MQFVDIDKVIDTINIDININELRFIFLDDYKLTGDFLVVSDMKEFMKMIKKKIIVFSIDSTNEWIQLQEYYNIVLRDVDKYFDKKGINIPLSQRASSIG